MLLNLAHIFYWIVVLLHVYFAVLEMGLWKQYAPRIFGITPEFAHQSAALASNQGLYNIFIVIALIIGFFAPIMEVGICFMLYGLSCVIAAGIWGAVTVDRKIFFIQAAPAIAALVLRLMVML